MDSRRLPRTVIDPKVRHVGFFTSGDPPPARSLSVPAETGASALSPVGLPSPSPTAELSLTGNSLAAAMTPPKRNASAEGIHSLVRAAASSTPITAHGVPSPRRRDGIQISIGSYNPSEPNALSQVLSPSSSRFEGTEFSDETAASAWLKRTGSGKEAGSFFGSSSDLMMSMESNATTPFRSALTTVSVVKTLPEITVRLPPPKPNQGDGGGEDEGEGEQEAIAARYSDASHAWRDPELHPPLLFSDILPLLCPIDWVVSLGGGNGRKDGGASIETLNEGAGTVISVQKTTKAERRAIQEGQRAAKAATKEAVCLNSLTKFCFTIMLSNDVAFACNWMMWESFVPAANLRWRSNSNGVMSCGRSYFGPINFNKAHPRLQDAFFGGMPLRVPRTHHNF
ncbi:hypothetical protein KSP40_PGU012283 [Platanthera guangdongensis]|uniref:Uncharacterized protein n=1 Tax=Platanthera guangdongensis TaxID=2320717 RepID=A0ABR2MDD7_9ASPA